MLNKFTVHDNNVDNLDMSVQRVICSITSYRYDVITQITLCTL